MRIVVSFSFITILLAGAFFPSCKKDKGENPKAQGQVEFAISVNALQSSLKSGSSDITSILSSVVITVEDATGTVVKNSEKIDLYNMNGDYISKPISMVKGNYKLTRFFVLDQKNNIVLASPVTGSAKAYLVQAPLPISFNVQFNVVTKLTPEVLSTVESVPEDFGYATFSFDEVKTFDFLIGTFVYNETIKNFELTTANISISSGSTIIYSGQLNNNQNDLTGTGMTNKITLPEKYSAFTLNISKPGYKSYSQIFTKEELKLHLRSVDKGPLVVILEKSDFMDGLIAYYKFNGDMLDYSGNDNNGTYYGRGNYTSGRLADPKAALDLNGSSDYVIVKNSASLNPSKQISLCSWYYTVPFYGNGANPLIEKFTTTSTFWYQYALTVTGNSYVGSTGGTDWRKFAFYIRTTQGSYQLWAGPSTNFVKYDLYKWYFVVGTYDGDLMKLYVNGELTSQLKAAGDFIIYDSDVNIGKSLNSRIEYDFLAGSIDEIRVYNRALSQEEIVGIYQQ
jgi:hypothetical protein